MLTQVIKFEMHNTSDIFVVPATEDNYELIAGNRYTRQIKFVEMFDFQVSKEMKAPAFFIETLAQEYIEEITAIEESELFYCDEMVGTY